MRTLILKSLTLIAGIFLTAGDSFAHSVKAPKVLTKEISSRQDTARKYIVKEHHDVKAVPAQVPAPAVAPRVYDRGTSPAKVVEEQPGDKGPIVRANAKRINNATPAAGAVKKKPVPATTTNQ